MANVIKHKRGSGSDPVASDLVVGEVAIRTDVGKLFTKMDNGSVAEIAGGGSDIAINTLSSSSATGGGSATFNGSAYRFTLSAPPSVSAQQLLVSINGVIQKPVAGTGQPSEGFSVDGTDIILGDAPATGSDFFILTFKSLGVSEPADNSVTSAKIVNGAIVNADINASAAIAGTKISPDFGSQNIITTGNINIGAGTGRLDSNGIIKTAHGTESAPSHTFINDTDNGMFRVTTNTIGFTTGGSERLRIKSDGTVGIGTTDFTTVGSPNKNFVVGSTTNAQEVATTLNVMEGTNNRRVKFFLDDDDGVFGIDSTASTGVAPFVVRMAQSEKLRIDQSGNVGVGESASIDAKLHVNSGTDNATLFIESTDGDVNLCMADNAGSCRLLQSAGDLHFRTGGNANAFGTGDSERMVIDSSGNVGIGTSSPDALLHLSGTNPFIRFTDTVDSSHYAHIGHSDTSIFVLDADAANAHANSGIEFKVDNSSVMFLKNGGNVGIGTTSPSTKLHITGDITLEDPSPSISFVDNDQDSDFKLVVNSHQFRIYDITNASTRFVLDSSGNVGIGTTSPSSELHVVGSITQTGAGAQNSHRFGSAVPFFYGQFNSSGDASINNQASANLLLATANTERMRIDSSGNVAIGTTSPVNNSGYGGITLNGGSGAIFSFKDSDIEKTRLALVANDTFSIQYPPGSSGHFRIDSLSADGSGNITGATERMRVDSSGNVGIGQSPSYRLDVIAGQGAVSRFRQATNNQGITHACIILRHQAASSSQQGVGMVFQNSSGSEVGSIRFGPSTSYNTTSDYRLKENVIPISDGITRLKTLKPSRFNWKEDASFTVDGFLAHEVTAVPEAITGTKDEVDSDNNPVYQSIDQSKLVPLLVAALQEAIGRIEALEAK